ncbi:MAG: hypothetical protein HN904_03715, partial [Victivallales bacterium]|nr:hypothetical protein [Victivallales bacterium]
GLERSEQQQRPTEVNLEPPPIFRSTEPAILVIFLGEPKFQAVKGTKLLYAVNTNWDVFLEVGTPNIYLLNGDGWLTTSDLKSGQWKAATQLPADLRKLPDDANWEAVRANLPGKPVKAVPKVFVAKRPSELIVTDGAASYSPVGTTPLLYVANSESDIFLHTRQGNHYFLTAGRWFRAQSLDGPWTAATSDLPPEFALIPEDHPRAYVLSSVPGTPDAEAAVLLASIPRKATVKRSEVKVTVVYEGKPQFVKIDGTTVYYAANTPNSVLKVGKDYYCCHQGIWFVAKSPAGPWAVASSVPKVIYTIPASHPKHNLTYVYVYDSTPDTVIVGYTSGYSGSYVAASGLLMFGLGYWLGNDDHHHHYSHYHHHSHYYSYGSAARYDYHHGGYVRSAHVYGPYGGAGRGAAYNPRTGTYSRGAYRYGPRGSAGARQAYNPYTGRYAAQARANTPYGSWGRTAVSNGNDWARAGHRSQGGRTVAGFETSGGAKGIAGKNKWTGKSGAVVKNKHGDVYVGKNGNIYKRSDNGWQSRQGNSWKSVPTRTPTRTPTKTGTIRTPTRTSSRSSLPQLNRAARSRKTGNRLSGVSQSGRSRSSSRSSSTRSRSRSSGSRSSGRSGGGRRR